jgi:tetratricopeptide (TPR) repeat protein
VWHDGYLKAQLAHKRGRNLALLQQVLAERPGDAYFRYQLAREQEQAGDSDAAVASYLAALRERPRIAPPWREGAIFNAIDFLGRAQRFEEGTELIQAELPHCVGAVDFWFVLGGFFFELVSARPALAIEFMPRIEECYLRCLELGEQPQANGALRGRGSFLAARNLYAFYTATGDAERAETYRQLSLVEGSTP